MHSPIWRLEEHVARVRFDHFSATVDLAQPAKGIVAVCPGSGRPVGVRLLGIVGPSLAAGGTGPLIEQFARGTDLVATYRGPGGHQVQVEALWRVVRPTAAEKFVAAAELLVSIQTHQLDSRPELVVESHLAATEALRLLGADAADYRPLAPAPKAAVVVRPEEGPGCLLFRLSGAELSYAEMVHPADFRHDELVRFGADDNTMGVRHCLFAERLEKGVILRARVRAVLVPRDDDAHTVAESYMAFAAAGPPLVS